MKIFHYSLSFWQHFILKQKLYLHLMLIAKEKLFFVVVVSLNAAINTIYSLSHMLKAVNPELTLTWPAVVVTLSHKAEFSQGQTRRMRK